MPSTNDPFGARTRIETPLGPRVVYRLDAVLGAAQAAALPYSIKVLLEACLRHQDGFVVEEGHVKADFGLDTPFLQEQAALVGNPRESVRANIHKLVSFTAAVEKNCGISGRLLWSESEENLAQKLIARLQGVQ